MIFRYAPPAPEEWRAFWIQCAGCAGLLVVASLISAVRSNPILLLGAALGVLYLVAQSGIALRRKSQRARHVDIELRTDALVLRDSGTEDSIPWRSITRCEAVGAAVRIRWNENETQREWSFAPREIIDGQTLAREVKQRATPNFIALEAK